MKIFNKSIKLFLTLILFTTLLLLFRVNATNETTFSFSGLSNFNYQKSYNTTLSDLEIDISSAQKQGSDLYLGTNGNNIENGVFGNNYDAQFSNIKTKLESDSYKNEITYNSSKQTYVMLITTSINNVGGVEFIVSNASLGIVFDVYIYAKSSNSEDYRRYSINDIDLSWEYERKVRADFSSLITLKELVLVAIPRSEETASVRLTALKMYHKLSEECTVTIYDGFNYEIHDDALRNAPWDEDYPLEKEGMIFKGYKKENEEGLFNTVTGIINETTNLFAVYEYDDDLLVKKIKITSSNLYDYGGYSDTYKVFKNLGSNSIEYKRVISGTNSTLQINSNANIRNTSRINNLKRITLVFDESTAVNNINEISITYGINSNTENLGALDNVYNNYTLSLFIPVDTAGYFDISKVDSGVCYIKEIIIETKEEVELETNVYVQVSSVVNGFVNVRFVGTSLTYKNVEYVWFEVEVEHNSKTASEILFCTTLYNSISASPSGVNNKITAESLNANYLFAYTIKNVPVDTYFMVASFISLDNNDYLESDYKLVYIDEDGNYEVID